MDLLRSIVLYRTEYSFFSWANLVFCLGETVVRQISIIVDVDLAQSSP